MTSSTTLQTTTTEMPLIMHDDVMEKELYPSEPERPRIIDYGGLPPENGKFCVMRGDRGSLVMDNLTVGVHYL